MIHAGNRTSPPNSLPRSQSVPRKRLQINPGAGRRVDPKRDPSSGPNHDLNQDPSHVLKAARSAMNRSEDAMQAPEATSHVATSKASAPDSAAMHPRTVAGGRKTAGRNTEAISIDMA
jgi:hypothetical protein